MLHIIGIILKVIGIILLVILALVVLLLCIILFVPVRYQGDAAYPSSFKECRANLCAVWFLHLVRVDVRYEKGKLGWNARLAWKKIGGEEDDRNEEKTSVMEEKPEKSKEKEEDHRQLPESVSEQKVVFGHSVHQNKIPESAKEEKIDPKPKRKKPIIWRLKQKVISIYQKIKAMIITIFEKLKYTGKKICGKMEEGQKVKEKIETFLTDEAHQKAWAKTKKQRKWIKRFLKPKVLEGRLHLGFEDPCTTGQVLAVGAVLYPFTEGRLEIVPDFENPCLDGNGRIKGTLRLINLVIPGLKLLFDRNVRKTYRDIRNFK